MKKWLLLFVVLMTAVFLKSRSLDDSPGRTNQHTIEQLQKEIIELKKGQENKGMAFSN